MFIHMRRGANKSSSLTKWFKLEAYIFNLVGKTGRRKGFYERNT